MTSSNFKEPQDSSQPSAQPVPRKVKEPRLPDLAAVPNPTPTDIPSGVIRTASRARSAGKLRERAEERIINQAAKFLEFAQVIRVPCTLSSLQNVTQEQERELMNICNTELGPSKPAQCMSARFIDSDGETLFCYFSRRIAFTGMNAPAEIPLKDQYVGRTLSDWNRLAAQKGAHVAFDGLHPDKCRLYHIAVQRLALSLPIYSRNDEGRHEAGNIMAYNEVDRYEFPLDPDVPTRVIHMPTKFENAGVIRLCHGWIQQGHSGGGGLYISGDISHSSSSLSAVGSYYTVTREVAEALAIMFEVAFPDHYAKYRDAFKAGVWLPEDPGPFLGRSIVYKLQGRLHKDSKDLGPSACFPVGFFEGGEMFIPQFKTKLLYEPGSVCIFYSSIIYHKVARFNPLPQTHEQRLENITPGRIGTVMFFPKPSYEILKGKKEGWARKTNFGKNEDLIK